MKMKSFGKILKIYRNFTPECMKNECKRDKEIESFIIDFSRLCSYFDFQDKVSEFIYYRSLYKMEHEEEEDFILLELKYQFLGYFFEKMFINGAVYEYQYDGERNLYQENTNADLSYSSLKDAQVVDCIFQGCNLLGTTLPDGSCFDTQQEQEEHLNALMWEQK